MQCPSGSKEGSGLAISYIAGKLDPDAAAAFEQHLQVCLECRRIAAEQRAVWSALDGWEPEAVSSSFDQKLLERLAEQRKTAWRLQFRWRSVLPVAAACAVLAAALVVKQPMLAPAQPSVRIEQVEHALDDMDLLNRLDVQAPAKPVPSEHI